MATEGTYLGMPIRISDLDRENQDFFRFCISCYRYFFRFCIRV